MWGAAFVPPFILLLVANEIEQCSLRLRDTVDPWTFEANNEIHFVVPRNSIMVSTCKRELQGPRTTPILTVQKQ